MKDEVYLKMLGAAVWESPVPIYVIHVEVDEAGKPVDWRFAYANEAEAKHLSIPLEKLLGRSGIELFTTTIRDNGIGMTKEFLAHIFEAFTRERSSTESRRPGFGLGMGIAKKLTELMGGTIAVESEPGKGTTFTVRIPHRIAKGLEEAFPAEDSALPDTTLQGRRILLAEDNDLNAEIAEELLKEAGLLVERARDGIECLAMLEKREPLWYDLILMDIQMPNMDGYKATTIIRHLEDPRLSKIPIIAMTANAFAEDKAKAIALGMNAHVAKPFDIRALKRVMADVLGKQ